ncbi:MULTISPECIES: TetR/AcrR family transcriptional regulator [unclassified Acinetobacter]|uniref:TetR/AcrR family transcriptional regulator n=1 Tax=unclassified Acinetobacter TaxID=196816 RepID=UPI002935021B|nr:MULTISPECIES: TetR/AcrR family transcriptional regulator [unclassified Acinetobacter]WOE33264.1 TetR/AcrR family transcriptional regulator [Acinetobacter sp. SAAs470]WOE36955.1 TetR/AcrR family transcriptional regulator [Acinetobacter sp. SAAs474]
MEIQKTRSNSKKQIITAAFENFVVHGYEGASLSLIADMVGIRKASIYTHFSSKEALFLELLQQAIIIECDYIRTCFAEAGDEKLPGEAYCYALKKQYSHSVSLRFLIRMAYAPPADLIVAITDGYFRYIQVLLQQIQSALRLIDLNEDEVTLYSDAYLGIIDSLTVELLYDQSFYERRLKALLFLYQNTLQQSLLKQN